MPGEKLKSTARQLLRHRRLGDSLRTHDHTVQYGRPGLKRKKQEQGTPFDGARTELRRVGCRGAFGFVWAHGFPEFVGVQRS